MLHFASTKTIIYLAIYSTVVHLSNSIVNGHLVEENDDNIQRLFNSFIEKFEKTYADKDEYNLRYEVFKVIYSRIF